MDKILLGLILVVAGIVMLGGCDQDNPQPAKDGADTLSIDTTDIGDTVVVDTVQYIEGVFTLMNLNSGKVLGVLDGAISSNQPITQWRASDAEDQKWTISHDDLGYLITNLNSELVLSVENRSADVGSTIVQSMDLFVSSHRWNIEVLEDSVLRIINKNSGLDLDVHLKSSAENSTIIQSKYTGALSQQWQLTDGAGGSANGQLSWTLVSENVPADAKERITAAMNAAVARYNYGIALAPRTLTVEYNPGVPTADATLGGHIRFGSGSGFQNERTALHEIAHTYGVGTSQEWYQNIVEDGSFGGAAASTLIQVYDGEGTRIWTGSSHFWPYGLNYNNEWSEVNAQRHVEIISSMLDDGIY